MYDRHKTKGRMEKKFKENNIKMNGHEFDITVLDAEVRRNSVDHAKMKELVEGLINQFNKFELQCLRAERLSRWEAWVMDQIPKRLLFQEMPLGIPIYPTSTIRSDDPYAMVRAAVMATRDDDDDDSTTPVDSQPIESRESPHDHQQSRIIVYSLFCYHKPGMSVMDLVLMKAQPLTQAGIDQLIQQRVNSAIAAKREREQKSRRAMPMDQKTEMVFSVSHCAKENKVMYAAATFQDWALTWWNSQVSMLVIEVPNGKS
ncbi:hypothetical protein Tco_1226854 [Tanacetum coccineum]